MLASGIASATPPANPLVEVLARSPSLTGLKGKLEALLARGMLGQQRFFPPNRGADLLRRQATAAPPLGAVEAILSITPKTRVVLASTLKPVVPAIASQR